MFFTINLNDKKNIIKIKKRKTNTDNEIPVVFEMLFVHFSKFSIYVSLISYYNITK